MGNIGDRTQEQFDTFLQTLREVETILIRHPRLPLDEFVEMTNKVGDLQTFVIEQSVVQAHERKNK